jgi:hypothetical protein
VKQLLFFLTILVLVSCSNAVASQNETVIQKNNQIATFNVSALSAQVIATIQEGKAEIQEDTTAEEDIANTPAYRLFTLQRDSTRFLEGLGIEGYEGSLLDLFSIDVDTTCYFCIPQSQRDPTD